jgi:hypothetical protein
LFVSLCQSHLLLLLARIRLSTGTSTAGVSRCCIIYQRRLPPPPPKFPPTHTLPFVGRSQKWNTFTWPPDPFLVSFHPTVLSCSLPASTVRAHPRQDQSLSRYRCPPGTMYQETTHDGGQLAVSQSNLLIGVVFRLEFGDQRVIQVRRGLEIRCEAFLDRLTMPRSKAPVAICQSFQSARRHTTCIHACCKLSEHAQSRRVSRDPPVEWHPAGLPVPPWSTERKMYPGCYVRTPEP